MITAPAAPTASASAGRSRAEHPLVFAREFAREFGLDRRSTGAVAPSSRALARELTRPLRGIGSATARTILEVGPGTGAVTRHIAAAMDARDRLDLVEANPRFAHLLAGRLGAEPPLARIRPQARLLAGRIEDVDLDEGRYDAIVCGLPFANFEPDVAEAILEQLFAALHPRGRLSFFAYAGLPVLRSAASGPARRRRLALTRRIVGGFLAQYGVDRALVLGNLPPAWVHHLAGEPVRR